jgi:aminoglycoside phosphotransferase (APT) family kinase protein
VTDLQDAVARAVDAHWPGVVTGPLRTLEGGRSGITLVAEVSGAPVEAVVVKAAPDGRPAVGRHDIHRQGRIIGALAHAPGVAVADVVATGTDPLPFLVMTRAVGEAVEPVLDAATISLEAGLVRSRALAAARMLAALHAVEQIPPPPGEGSEPIADLPAELTRWRATAEAADPAVLIGGLHLADLLDKTMPDGATAPALVHGDYRLGNIVFDGATPTGLIDWEIWARADAGIDLGWFLVFCDASLFPGIGASVDGLPSSTELVQAYVDAGGRPVDNLPWYEAFGRFKMAAIMAHNLRRHREGRHVDPYQEKLPPTIARLAETGIELLND